MRIEQFGRHVAEERQQARAVDEVSAVVRVVRAHAQPDHASLGLRQLPQYLEFVQRKIGERFAVGGGALLHKAESAGRISRSLRASRRLGVDAERAREIHEREEDVAELFANVRIVLLLATRFGEFGQLLDELLENAVDVRPVEADARGLLLHALPALQGAEVFRDTVEPALARASRLLSALSCSQFCHCESTSSMTAIAEDVRVAANHLV